MASSRATLKTEIAVVGAGPTGSAAAIAFARRGARVVLVDGYPKAARRFAGEWIHPPGAAVLRCLGIDTHALGTSHGHGLVILGDDGQDPVCLPYAEGSSITRVHSELVTTLREHACALESVTYLPEHVLTGIEGVELTLEDRRGQRVVTVAADRIIGADGRSSKVRGLLWDGADSEVLSYMAGLELRDAELPFEGMAHVVVGGPGPVLLYRLDGGTVRACLDVPSGLPSSERQPQALGDSFGRVLPPQLAPAFRRALRGRIAWAATRWRRRSFLGKANVWLAGDAAGHVHPLSGVGLTLGLLDAAAAARVSSLSEYRRERDVHVVEVLSGVLYQAFARHDPSAIRLRHALFRMLRASPCERQRTMRLLTGEDRSGISLARSFMGATSRVLIRDFERTTTRRQSISELTHHLRQDAAWLRWPVSACVPPMSTRSSL